MEKLHPPLVHFAIAYPIASFLFDLIYLVTKKESFKRASLYILVLGFLAVLGAYLSGHLAEERVEELLPKGGKELLERHELLGTVLLYLIGVLTLVRIALNLKESLKALRVYLVVMLVSVALILFQGYLGGTLVYEYGAGVKTKKVEKEKTKQEKEVEEEKI